MNPASSALGLTDTLAGEGSFGARCKGRLVESSGEERETLGWHPGTNRSDRGYRELRIAT